jgi:hypothetical protein
MREIKTDRMSGPKINPIGPKKMIPPKIENKMKTGEVLRPL